MAKKIKVIKCPQCGNSKPLSIGKEHYRCDKCGTEFFLDNDDINVNVNHRYEQPQTNRGNSNSGTSALISGAVIISLIIIIGLFSTFRFCSRQIRNTPTTASYADSTHNRSNYLNPTLFAVNGKAVVFYIEHRRHWSASNSRNVFFAVFYDLTNGQIIREEALEESHPRIRQCTFVSDSTCYFIVNEKNVYRIHPEEYTFKNIAEEINSAKPALNAGFSSIQFVPQHKGEGFRIMTNLGKEFFYFPVSNTLYTEKAFEHVANGQMKTLSEDARKIDYYLFLNKESKQSSNVAQLHRITYSFNNGGPENKLTELTEKSKKYAENHRISSITPITDELICFSPKVLWFDDKNILISYRPTLKNDAETCLQLLNTEGKSLWTISYSGEVNWWDVIKTNAGYLLQTDKNVFYEITADGSQKNKYSL